MGSGQMPRSKSVQSKKASPVAGETKPPEPAKQEGSAKPAAEQRGHAKQMKQGDDVPPKVPVTAVFSFLKDTRGAVTWTADDLARTLKVKKHEAEKVLSVLELQGYVHRSGEDEWLTADDLARTLKVKKHEAEKVLSVLELQGYVHRSGE